MLSKKEFYAKNQRRLDLIDKEHSGFTKEESSRRFDLVSGWKEECERRYHTNLTDEERAELEQLNKEVDDYCDEKWPLPTFEDLLQRADLFEDLLQRADLTDEQRAGIRAKMERCEREREEKERTLVHDFPGEE